MRFNRRQIFVGAGAATLAGFLPGQAVRAAAPLLAVSGRTLEVKGKAASVFSVTNAAGRSGIMAKEGDRFSGDVVNRTKDALVMHWHGQINAANDQDRARPKGGELAVGAAESHDFLLTPGTHWMHSHQLTEQQLLAAPMVTRERNAGDVQDVVVMLHDFSFRSPAEILAGLGGSSAHGGGHGASQAAPNPPTGMPGGGMSPGMGGMNHGSNTGAMPGMGGMMSGMGGMMNMKQHANDVAYDAYLANDRTLDDPEVIRVDKGGRVRLRIINGGTATVFFIDTGVLDASCVAVDGSPCEALRGRLFPLAQGQRIDLVVDIPATGGAFPILAQVEADRRRTGVVLATAGAAIGKIIDLAPDNAAYATLSLDERLRATNPLVARAPDRTYRLMLGEEPGYRWPINGRVHGEDTPLEARVGERVALIFMNPTSMMHPMHLHGHHFQVLGSGTGQFSGPVRDTVIVPPHTPVMVAFDAKTAGDWFLHCHHLYHMATGMMTSFKIS